MSGTVAITTSGGPTALLDQVIQRDPADPGPWTGSVNLVDLLDRVMRRLKADPVEAWIRALAASAPPLSPGQRARLAALLPATPGDAA